MSCFEYREPQCKQTNRQADTSGADQASSSTCRVRELAVVLFERGLYFERMIATCCCQDIPAVVSRHVFSFASINDDATDYQHAHAHKLNVTQSEELQQACKRFTAKWIQRVKLQGQHPFPTLTFRNWSLTLCSFFSYRWPFLPLISSRFKHKPPEFGLAY